MLPLASAGFYFEVVTSFWINKMMWVTSWKSNFECWNTKVQIFKHNYWFSESLFLNGLNLDAFVNLISECWVPPFWNQHLKSLTTFKNLGQGSLNTPRTSSWHLAYCILFFSSENLTYIWKTKSFWKLRPSIFHWWFFWNIQHCLSCFFFSPLSLASKAVNRSLKK